MLLLYLSWGYLKTKKTVIAWINLQGCVAVDSLGGSDGSWRDNNRQVIRDRRTTSQRRAYCAVMTTAQLFQQRCLRFKEPGDELAGRPAWPSTVARYAAVTVARSTAFYRRPRRRYSARYSETGNRFNSRGVSRAARHWPGCHVISRAAEAWPARSRRSYARVEADVAWKAGQSL